VGVGEIWWKPHPPGPGVVCGWSEQGPREGATCPHLACCVEIDRYCRGKGVNTDGQIVQNEREY